MNPNQLVIAWMGIVQDTFGHQGQFRQEPMTLEEWKLCDDRWLTLKQLNLRALALKGEGENGERNGNA